METNELAPWFLVTKAMSSRSFREGLSFFMGVRHQGMGLLHEAV